MFPAEAIVKCVVQIKSKTPSLTCPNPHLNLGGVCVLCHPFLQLCWDVVAVLQPQRSYILLPIFQQLYL